MEDMVIMTNLPIPEGMIADELLAIPGREAKRAIKQPTVKGQDERGHIVLWHYGDCDIEMRWWDGCYRVYAVHPRDVQSGADRSHRGRTAR